MARQVISVEESDDFVVGAAPIKEVNPMLQAIAKKKDEAKKEEAKGRKAEKAKNAASKEGSVPEAVAAPVKEEKVVEDATPNNDEAVEPEPVITEGQKNGEDQKKEEEQLRKAVEATSYAINYSLSAEDMIDLITCCKITCGNYKSGMRQIIHDFIEHGKSTIEHYDVFRANEAAHFYEKRIRKIKEKQAETQEGGKES